MSNACNSFIVVSATYKTSIAAPRCVDGWSACSIRIGSYYV